MGLQAHERRIAIEVALAVGLSLGQIKTNGMVRRF